MKAAIVTGPDQTPMFSDFEEPVAGQGEQIVHVSAAATSHLARMRASGRHYSASGRFPFVVGVDGVGRLEDGRRVCFVLPRAPFGAMAERTVVATDHCVPIPDCLDDVTAAAIANPGMSSWAALTHRAKFQPGETVLINGATGASGRLAVKIARHMGAKRIIATGRNPDALREIAASGADSVIPLTEDGDALEARFKPAFAQGVDVVLDYLWGTSARALLIAAAKEGAEGVPMRFVQIGSMSGGEIALPAAVLRSSAIQLMGSGIGSISLDGLIGAIGNVMQAAVPAGLSLATEIVPLSQIAQAWEQESSARRMVFSVNGAMI